MRRLFRPAILFLEALLLVIGLWVALMQLTWLWVQVAPEQVRAWLDWVSGGRVQVQRVELSHDLMLPHVMLTGVAIRTKTVSFDAQRLRWGVDYRQGRLIHELGLARWQLVLANDALSNMDIPLDLEALQQRWTLAYPRWPLPVDRLELRQGLLRQGDWQVVSTALTVERQGGVISGEGELTVVYDRVPVWQGRMTLNGRVDWRDRIISGTLEGRMARPTRLVDLAPLLQTRWHTGRLRMDGALRYRDRQPNLSLNLRLEGLNIRGRAGDGIDSLGAVLGWREQAGHRAFVIERWMINERVLSNQAPVMLVLGRNRVDVFLPHLDLARFRPALSALWPQWRWEETHFSADGLMLRYQIRPLRLRALSGTIHALAWPSSGNWPGVSLSDVTLSGSADRVEIRFGQPVGLVWAAWTDGPRALLRLDEPMRFGRTRKGWRLRPLAFSLDDVTGHLNWRGNSESGMLDVHVSPGDIRTLKRFLPYGLMRDTLSQWLRQGLLAGRLDEVWLRYAGPWEAMFGADSALQVSTRLKDGRLRFQPDWPVLEDMQAEVVFQPYALRVRLRSASIEGLRIREGQADIGPLDGDDIALTVRVRADGSVKQAQALVHNSPLLHRLALDGVLGSTLKLTGGRVDTETALWIPLSGFSDRALESRVALDFSDVSARLPGGLAPQALNGQVEVRVPGHVKGRLQGTLFGKPLSIRLADDGRVHRLQLALKGQLPLSRYLAQARGWLHVRGRLELPMKDARGVTFDMRGTMQLFENRLPAPLNQWAAQPLNLTGRIERRVVDARLALGEQVWLQGRWEKANTGFRLRRAVMLLGESPAVVRSFAHYAPEDFVVSVALKEWNVDAWVKWWAQQKKRLPELPEQAALPPLYLALRADTMQVAAQRFDSVVLLGQTLDEQRLAFRLRARQADMTGILIPDTRQMALSIERLRLRRPDVEAPEQCVEWQRPSDFRLFVVGRNVRMGALQFDRIRFNLYGDPAQLRLEGIDARAQAGAVHLKASALWRYGDNVTRLRADFLSNDVARFLRWAGFESPGFSGEKAVVGAALSWPGPPDCLMLKTLNGKVSFRLDDGVIEQARPGLAKLFSVLSVDSLLRSLKVTAGALQHEGMVYSKIEGDIALRKGWGHVKRIFMDAPALQAELKGGVDLVRRRFALKAKVTPQIGGTLTTLLSVVGLANPLTAVGTYLFLKNIPSANPNLVSYHYRIVGPWDKPRIINTETGEVVGQRTARTPEKVMAPEDILDQ